MILSSNLEQWGDISQDVFEFLTARVLPLHLSPQLRTLSQQFTESGGTLDCYSHSQHSDQHQGVYVATLCRFSYFRGDDGVFCKGVVPSCRIQFSSE